MLPLAVTEGVEELVTEDVLSGELGVAEELVPVTSPEPGEAVAVEEGVRILTEVLSPIEMDGSEEVTTSEEMLTLREVVDPEDVVALGAVVKCGEVVEPNELVEPSEVGDSGEVAVPIEVMSAGLGETIEVVVSIELVPTEELVGAMLGDTVEELIASVASKLLESPEIVLLVKTGVLPSDGEVLLAAPESDNTEVVVISVVDVLEGLSSPGSDGSEVELTDGVDGNKVPPFVLSAYALVVVYSEGVVVVLMLTSDVTEVEAEGAMELPELVVVLDTSDEFDVASVADVLRSVAVANSVVVV